MRHRYTKRLASSVGGRPLYYKLYRTVVVGTTSHETGSSAGMMVAEPPVFGVESLIRVNWHPNIKVDSQPTRNSRSASALIRHSSQSFSTDVHRADHDREGYRYDNMFSPTILIMVRPGRFRWKPQSHPCPILELTVYVTGAAGGTVPFPNEAIETRALGGIPGKAS